MLTTSEKQTRYPARGLTRRLAMTIAGALSLCAVAVTTAPVHAAPISKEAAEAYIQELGDKVVGLLNDGSLSSDELKRRMADIVREGVDIQQVGVLSAGRAWRQADDEQKSQFLDLFEQYVISTYSRRLDEYSGTTFDVTGSQAVGKEDIMVVTRVQGPNTAPSDVGWRLRDRGNGPQIIDVDFGGVSMLKTQREEFASVIERAGGDFDALIDALQKKVQAG